MQKGEMVQNGIVWWSLNKIKYEREQEKKEKKKVV